MNIGLLMARDEADVIQEVLDEAKRQGIDTIYALCGDEATLEVVRAHPSTEFAMLDRDAPQPVTDGARGLLYEEAVKDHGHGHWMFTLCGDEIFHSDVPRALAAIDPAQHNILYALQATFVFHEEERATADSEDPSRPVQERRLWHFFTYREPRAFISAPDMHYDPLLKRRVYPHWGPNDDAWRIAPTMLLVKNYPARTPDQFRVRIKDRFDRDWAPPYARFLPRLFISDLADAFEDSKNPDVYCSPFQRFDGRFRLYACKDWFFDTMPGSEAFRAPPWPNPGGP